MKPLNKSVEWLKHELGKHETDDIFRAKPTCSEYPYGSVRMTAGAPRITSVSATGNVVPRDRKPTKLGKVIKWIGVVFAIWALEQFLGEARGWAGENRETVAALWDVVRTTIAGWFAQAGCLMTT